MTPSSPRHRYRVEYSSRAERQLDAISGPDRTRIVQKIVALAENPRPVGSRKLEGADAAWRIRVGRYRVLYEVHDNIVRVFIFKIAHRSKAYRDL